MSHHRSTRLPIEHVTAEMIAFPLASEAAFRLAITRLNAWPKNESTPVGNSFARKVGGATDAAITADLWRQAERELISTTAMISLDEIHSLRDRVWFSDLLGGNSSRYREQSVPLTDYLRKIATWYLTSRGSVAVPCLGGFGAADDESSDSRANKARSREAWRWLSLSLSPDHLLAAIDTGRRPGPVRVETMAPQLAEELRRKGFSEMHLHWGASLTDETLWITTQLGLAAGRVSVRSLASPGAELSEGRELGGWILRASLVRLLLAQFLKAHQNLSGRDINNDETLDAYLTHFALPCLSRECGTVAAVTVRLALRELTDPQTRIGIDESSLVRIAGTAIDASARIRSFDGGITADGWPVDLLRRVREADPIADEALFMPSGDGASSEVRFVRAALEYSQSHRNDRLFETLFLQVIRIRNLFYRHIVQRPLTPGLQWFVRSYSRLGPAKKIVTPHLLAESSADTSGEKVGLRSLEVRTAPDSDRFEMWRLISSGVFRATGRPPGGTSTLLDQLNVLRWKVESGQRASDQPHHGSSEPPAKPEFGIVLHIVRKRGNEVAPGVPSAHGRGSHADPSQARPENRVGNFRNLSGYRFATFYNERRREVETLARILEQFPRSLQWIRGMDACTDELGVPSWVIAPFFRYLRDVSARVSERLLRLDGLEVPALRTTIHAGEDFVHLLGGLRRIDKAIRYFRLREGDRIGHGIALGIDATQWAQSAGRVLVTREERLFDLVWEWVCYSRYRVPATADRRACLEREIARLSTLIYTEARQPYELESLVELLHIETVLHHAGFPDRGTGVSNDRGTGVANNMLSRAECDKLRHSLDGRHLEISKPVWKLLTDYLTDKDVFRRGQETEWVDPSDEAHALEGIQFHLRSRIASLGIAVEINPTSNLLIGDLSDLQSHPLWRLNPPGPLREGVVRVPVCIGSDDPSVFATNLPNEYSLLRDAIVLNGDSSVDADEWIDRVRECGLRMRFTLRKTVGTPFDAFPQSLESLPIRPLPT
jgi:hypothetical protein